MASGRARALLAVEIAPELQREALECEKLEKEAADDLSLLK